MKNIGKLKKLSVLHFFVAPLGGVFGFWPEFGLFEKGPIYVRSKAFFFCKEKIIIFLSKFFLNGWNRFYVA